MLKLSLKKKKKLFILFIIIQCETSLIRVYPTLLY